MVRHAKFEKKINKLCKTRLGSSQTTGMLGEFVWEIPLTRLWNLLDTFIMYVHKEK